MMSNGKMSMAGKSEAVEHAAAVKNAVPDVLGVEWTAGHKNMLHLIQLRWIAVLGQITTITAATLGFGISLPLPQMLSVLACLIAFNIGSHLRWHERQIVTNGELFHALLVDVGSLTAMLYFSGGITNPFAFLYLLQVILSAVLLKPWSTWTIVAVTSVCLAGLAVFYVPLKLPPDQERYFFNLYVQGMLICFMSNAALLAYFITRIGGNLRVGDAQLAHLRQRAAEEDHIVRMGLLASGAAHALGTPLSSLSVILGDWRRMPALSADPELAQELEEMQAAVQRCKSIVTGILISAGEARGEAPTVTTVNAFLDELVADWRAARSTTKLYYDNEFGEDLPIISDSALKHVIFNVLDNALGASPSWLNFTAGRGGSI